MNLRVFYLYKTVGFGWLLYFCSNIKVLTMVKPRNTANTNEL